MKKSCIRLPSIILFGILVVSYPVLSTEVFPDTVTLKIDASRRNGEIPYLFRTGVFLNSLPLGYPLEKFFKDHVPGQMEFSWDFYPELLQSTSLKDFTDKLPSSNLTQWVKHTNARGGEVLIRLMPVPKWLWKHRDGFRNPPGDYHGWAKFVEAIVDYFNNQLRIDARYVVWDEPDGFWQGTGHEYLELYKYSVLGVKRANKQAKIGGPATSIFLGKIHKEASTMPFIYHFIEYCSKTHLSELTMKRLPIDFLVWHTFDAAPLSPGRYTIEAEQARQWLKEFDYPSTTELNIGSWNALSRYPHLGFHVRDSEFMSAYIVSSILAMDTAGIQRHIFFNLFEDWIKTDQKSEFTDSLGLLTKNGVMKPSYHAFKALGLLTGERLNGSMDDPCLSAAASVDGKKFSLIISNFIPTDEMLMSAARDILNVKGYRDAELKRYGLQRDLLKDLLNKGKSIEDLQIPDRLKDDIEQIIAYVRKVRERQKKSVDMEIILENLPFNDRLLYTQYLIDHDHSNSYAVQEKVDTAVRTARSNAWQEGIKYLSQIWSREDVADVQGTQGRNDSLRELLKRIPRQKKDELLAAQKIFLDYFHKKIDEINTWEEVNLQIVEKDTIQPSQSFRINIPLKPYSVTLLDLSGY